MSVAQRVAPHIPYLRRFARVLTGSQASGDAYVAACLEAIIADPQIFDARLSARIAIYRVLARIWSSTGVHHEDGATSADTTALRNLEAIAPRARQAFLLTTLEGFSETETSTILDATPEDVAALLDEAGREIAGQVATSALIIEDEPLLAMELETLMLGLGHRVVGIARTHREAIETARRSEPGLIIADIQLADGSSGLDAVNELLTRLSVPVVFVTAYPERLLTGERPEPAFLISKPCRPETLKAVVSQALFFDRRAGTPRPKPEAEAVS